MDLPWLKSGTVYCQLQGWQDKNVTLVSTKTDPDILVAEPH